MRPRMAKTLARLAAAITCVALLPVANAVAAQPIAAWPFDEGSGAVARDNGALGLDGTLTGVGGPSWIAGVEGSALRFDGNDYVAVLDTPRLEPTKMTVAAWVRRAGSPGRFRYVFSKGASTCLRSAYGLYTASSGGAGFYVSGDGFFTVSDQVSPSFVWDGRWHRLAGTYDGATVRLFVDGVQVGDGVTGPTHIEYGMTSRAPYIGTYRGGCELPFNGDIDDVAVWDAALTSSQAEQDAIAPTETPATGPIGPAPGTRPTPSELVGPNGKSTTPERCTSVALNRRTVRGRSKATILATVRRGGTRLKGARVVLRAGKLRKAARTDSRGLARFTLRPRNTHKRVSIRVDTRSIAGCGTPVAYVRVRR
jgi:concanavalin A-like lectin/glucanase superfamily protein